MAKRTDSQSDPNKPAFDNSKDKTAKKTFSSFYESIDRQLEQHPQLGVIVLDGVVMACEKLGDLLKEFQEKITERKDQIKQRSDSSKDKDDEQLAH